MASVRDKIAAEHENILKVIAEIKKEAARERMERVVLVGIGAYINNVYNGIENILKQTLLSLNTTIAQTATWHRDLLEKASEAKIIDGNMADRIGHYMFFRHFFTHSYGFLIDENKMKPLIANIERDYLDFKNQIDAFISGR